jgi:hypothetical protein
MCDKEQYENNIRFEVLIMMNIKTEIFWDLIPYSLVGGYQCFGGTCHLQSRITLP